MCRWLGVVYLVVVVSEFLVEILFRFIVFGYLLSRLCRCLMKFRFFGCVLLQQWYWQVYGLFVLKFWFICCFSGLVGLLCSCVLWKQKLIEFRWNLFMLWFSQNCIQFSVVCCMVGLWKFRFGWLVRKLCRKYCFWCGFYCQVMLLKIDIQLLGGVLFLCGLVYMYQFVLGLVWFWWFLWNQVCLIEVWLNIWLIIIFRFSVCVLVSRWLKLVRVLNSGFILW